MLLIVVPRSIESTVTFTYPNKCLNSMLFEKRSFCDMLPHAKVRYLNHFQHVVCHQDSLGEKEGVKKKTKKNRVLPVASRPLIQSGLSNRNRPRPQEGKEKGIKNWHQSSRFLPPSRRSSCAAPG